MGQSTFGIRKIIIGIVVMLIGIAVETLSPHGLSGNLLSLLEFITTGFFAANGVEHLAGTFRGPFVRSGSGGPPLMLPDGTAIEQAPHAPQFTIPQTAQAFAPPAEPLQAAPPAPDQLAAIASGLENGLAALSQIQKDIATGFTATNNRLVVTNEAVTVCNKGMAFLLNYVQGNK